MPAKKLRRAPVVDRRPSCFPGRLSSCAGCWGSPSAANHCREVAPGRGVQHCTQSQPPAHSLLRTGRPNGPRRTHPRSLARTVHSCHFGLSPVVYERWRRRSRAHASLRSALLVRGFRRPQHPTSSAPRARRSKAGRSTDPVGDRRASGRSRRRCQVRPRGGALTATGELPLGAFGRDSARLCRAANCSPMVPSLKKAPKGSTATQPGQSHAV